VNRRVRWAAPIAVLAIAGFLLPSVAGTAPRWDKVDPGLRQQSRLAPRSSVALIVGETTPADDTAERLIRHLGGTVTRDLSIIGAFAARLPAEDLPTLTASPAVRRVWGDGRILMTGGAGKHDDFDTWDPNTVWRASIRLTDLKTGATGAGVTVALLDTGVSQVDSLGSRVLARVDLTPDHDGYDRFGHGTHLAGIIAGGSQSAWPGVAPWVNLVSVKVAGWDGATDVSVVIAGLQWVVAHRDQYGIRVLNLSFGTDSNQSYLVDPLDYAVEQVWFSGVLVVTSAGNRGPGAGTTNKPADDPYVLTVGAADVLGTEDRKDDVVAEFSSRGPTQDGLFKPDLVAPGISIVSDLAAGSTVEALHPDARVGTAYIKGTGTSQAAAIVSGVAALLFQANPALTPDQAKAILIDSAHKDLGKQSGGGAGLVDAEKAVSKSDGKKKSAANQGLSPSTGTGSLEASRGSFHVYADLDGDGTPELVTGEIDVLGQPWSGKSWSADAWASSAWPELTQVSSGWEAKSWSGKSWSGMVWDGKSWSAKSWSDASWDSSSWAALAWLSTAWS
jgi:serine protease AprX